MLQSMEKKNYLAAISYSGSEIADRTYSKLLTGPDSLPKLRAAYLNVLPFYFPESPAIPATPEIISAIGAAVVQSNDLVYYMRVQSIYKKKHKSLDIAGFMIKQTAQNFKQMPEHSVIVVAGDNASPFGPHLRHDRVVTPFEGVNSVNEYSLWNVTNPVQSPIPALNLTDTPTNLPTIVTKTAQQEGMVLPYSLNVYGFDDKNEKAPDGFGYIAVIFKGLAPYHPDLFVSVLPLACHSLMGQWSDSSLI